MTSARPRERSRWYKMMRRCYIPKDRSFRRYGGRGIYVEASWHDFSNFYADMGDCPEGMSLDRIDNDGPYSKENCRWASRKQQNYNKRTTARVMFRGKLRTYYEIAQILGHRTETIEHRIAARWPEEDLGRPVRNRDNIWTPSVETQIDIILDFLRDPLHVA